MLEEGLGYSALSVKAVSLTGEGERLQRSPVSSVENNIGGQRWKSQAIEEGLVPVIRAIVEPLNEI